MLSAFMSFHNFSNLAVGGMGLGWVKGADGCAWGSWQAGWPAEACTLLLVDAAVQRGQGASSPWLHALLLHGLLRVLLPPSLPGVPLAAPPYKPLPPTLHPLSYTQAARATTNPPHHPQTHPTTHPSPTHPPTHPPTRSPRHVARRRAGTGGEPGGGGGGLLLQVRLCRLRLDAQHLPESGVRFFRPAGWVGGWVGRLG